MPNIPGSYGLPGIYGPSDLILRKNDTELILREELSKKVKKDELAVLTGNYEDAAMALFEYMENKHYELLNFSNKLSKFCIGGFSMDWETKDFKLSYRKSDPHPPDVFIKIKTSFDKICKMKAFI